MSKKNPRYLLAYIEKKCLSKCFNSFLISSSVVIYSPTYFSSKVCPHSMKQRCHDACMCEAITRPKNVALKFTFYPFSSTYSTYLTAAAENNFEKLCMLPVLLQSLKCYVHASGSKDLLSKLQYRHSHRNLPHQTLSSTNIFLKKDKN